METKVQKLKAQINRLRTDVAPELKESVTAVADSLEALLDGSVKGGTVRAKRLTKKRRSEIASKAAKARWGTKMTQAETMARNPRDFDCCAYRSKSGKTGCGALRWYHDDPVHSKRHKFVEPFRKQTVEEERDALLGEVARLREAAEIALAELNDLHEFINGVNIKGLVLDYRYEDRQRVMNTVRAALAHWHIENKSLNGLVRVAR